MNTEVDTVETLLPAPGIRLAVELLARHDLKIYLDQLDHMLALEQQRIVELLYTAENISQLKRKKMLPESGELTLGNIMLANGEITRVQLDDSLRRQIRSGRRLGEELIAGGHATKGQVDKGLLLQQKLCIYALSVAMGLAQMAPTAQAAQHSAAMGVSVTVIANAKLRIDYQATQLTITSSDVARGYIQVSAASRFSVATNSRSGYLMEFYPIGNIFQSVAVDGLGNAVQLGSEGGAIVQRYPLPPELTQELSFRFTLHQDTQPGTYPWPLQLSIRAL